MARLYTDFPFSGTFGNLTVYRVGDKCYVRTKSSLDKKRFQKDPAFARSREKAALFGAAARLVKAFYQQLPKEVKRHGLFGQLTALAYKSLQEGKSGEAIVQELKGPWGIKMPVEQEPVDNTPVVKKQAQPGKQPSLSIWWVNGKGRLYKESRTITAPSWAKSARPATSGLVSVPDG